MFFRVLDRWIEFLEIFCMFWKITLADGDGDGKGHGRVAAGSGGQQQSVVVGGDMGNLIFFTWENIPFSYE